MTLRTLDDLENLLAEQQTEIDTLTRERDEAIALLKPARPEDGLLPAVQDAMQRLALAEPEAQRLRAQRKELLDALKKITEGRGQFSLDQQEFANNVIEEAKATALAAIAKAEGES